MPYDLTTMQSIYHGQDEIVEIKHNNVSVYQKNVGPDYTEPFYVQDMSGTANTIQIGKNGSAPDLTIEQSTDKSTWTTLGTTGSTPLNISVPANGKVYLRCSAGNWSNSFNGSYNYFNGATGNFKVGGNVMSLMYGSNFDGTETTFPAGGNDYKLTDLFRGNTHIVDASELLLPVTTMNWCCYYGMFKDCTSLTAAPALPATTLGQYCYSMMFENTAITTAPDLNAQNLPSNCYERMFNGCTDLVNAPSSLGSTTGTTKAGCCASMFQRCTSLETTPELLSPSLAQDAYHGMFNGCTSLNHVECFATSGIDSSGSTADWLNGVASTGTFVKATGTTWPTGVNGIPEGWTVQEQ